MTDSPKTADIAASRLVLWRLALILGSLAALGPFAIDTYLPAFPAIAADLGVSPAIVQASVGAYFLGLAVGQIFYGPISDQVGRKPPIYFGLVLFILGSLGCALAQSGEQLVAARFIQAIGGCAEMVVARAIVRDRLSQQDAVRFFSLLMLVMGIAPIIAPLLGGWLLTHSGWRTIFLFLAGFATLCLLASLFLLEESLAPARRQRQSPAGVLKIFGGLVRDRHFMGLTLTGGLYIAGMFAYIAGSPFVFIELYGVRPENFGFFFGSNALGLILAAQCTRPLLRYFSMEKLLRRALTVAALASLLLCGVAVTGIGGFPALLVPLFLVVASVGVIMPLTTMLAMGAQGAHAGNASSLLGIVQFSVSSFAGFLIGIFHDGSALPMVGLIAVYVLAALAVNLVTPAAPRAA